MKLNIDFQVSQKCSDYYIGNEFLLYSELAHDHATAGHLGRRKTLSRLISRFHWPHMR